MVHITALHQALNHGTRLKKVHKLIKFEQSQWMSEYINLCVDKRKNAASVNLKNFY